MDVLLESPCMLSIFAWIAHVNVSRVSGLKLSISDKRDCICLKNLSFKCRCKGVVCFVFFCILTVCSVALALAISIFSGSWPIAEYIDCGQIVWISCLLNTIKL